MPIGVVFILFALALPPRDAEGNPTAPFNTPFLVIGLVISLIAVTGWLWDAMREWRSTDQGGHVALAVAAGDVAVLHGGGGGSALIPAGRSEVALTEQEFRAPEPPPGVHMPGPSPWPFFIPIAVTVMLFGLIFSAVLIVGGLILALIGVGGWLRDALKEYDSTEEVGHAVPETRDPEKAWPKRLVPIFAGVIAISFLIALAPLGLSYINSLTPPSAGPTAVAVPAVPEISASTAVSFDTTTLIVPAGRPFELVFDNKQAGVPHNVRIDDSPAQTTIIFNGERITGPDTITYDVPAITAGTYYFLCEVHPNMNGTLVAQQESGPPPAPGPGGAPGPGRIWGTGRAGLRVTIGTVSTALEDARRRLCDRQRNDPGRRVRGVASVDIQVVPKESSTAFSEAFKGRPGTMMPLATPSQVTLKQTRQVMARPVPRGPMRS